MLLEGAAASCGLGRRWRRHREEIFRLSVKKPAERLKKESDLWGILFQERMWIHK
jgi:hypothetical protein